MNSNLHPKFNRVQINLNSTQIGLDSIYLCWEASVYAWSVAYTCLVIVCIFGVSIIDASVAGELPEEG
jgi:hypothetical protein